MSTVAISKNNAAVMNNDKVTMNNKTGWMERLKNYVLSNASYFAAASIMMNGNVYAAGQIMKNSRQ